MSYIFNFKKYSRLLQELASMKEGAANDGMLSDNLTLKYKPPNGQHKEMLKSLLYRQPNTAAIAHTACMRGTSRDSFCVQENDKGNAVCHVYQHAVEVQRICTKIRNCNTARILMHLHRLQNVNRHAPLPDV